MSTRTLKYNLNYSAAASVDNGTAAFTALSKYTLSNKVDFSYQNTFDLVSGIETIITVPGLNTLELITWNAINPISIAFQLDTQLTPQPIYSTPTVYGVYKFTDAAPLFSPSFIKIKSIYNTSVEIVLTGNR